MGCSFKFIFKVSVEDSIVNASYGLRITDQLFKSYVFYTSGASQSTFNANSDRKLK
jgi:hypothetical protein